MLLRFLQKGLTFHNIPLMPGITAQDDENVVYSKQIGGGRKQWQGQERPNILCSGPRRGEQSTQVRSPSLKAPGEAWDVDSQRELAQTETAPTLACLAQGVIATTVHGVLLSARQHVSS